MQDKMQAVNKKFKNACKENKINEVILTIQHGANNWASGLYLASAYGHKEIAELLVTKTDNLDDLNEGLVGACLGGYVKILELMIASGACAWNRGLKSACGGGQLEIAKMMVSRGAHYFDEGLRIAYSGQYSNGYPHLKLVEFMIDQGATNFDQCLHYACSEGYVELAKIIICKWKDRTGGGVDVEEAVWINYINEGLKRACAGKHIELVKLMVQNGATNLDESLTGLIKYHNNKPNNKADPIIRWLASKGAKYGEFKLFENDNNHYYLHRH